MFKIPTVIGLNFVYRHTGHVANDGGLMTAAGLELPSPFSLWGEITRP